MNGEDIAVELLSHLRKGFVQLNRVYTTIIALEVIVEFKYRINTIVIAMIFC